MSNLYWAPVGAKKVTQGFLYLGDNFGEFNYIYLVNDKILCLKKQWCFRSRKSILINVLCLLLVLIELLGQTIWECVRERVCPRRVCVVNTNIEPVSSILNTHLLGKKWRENVSSIHPQCITVSFRLGNRRDEFSTCRASCDPEKKSWLIGDRQPPYPPWATSWQWWHSWGAPDLVCPVYFSFLFRCHAPCRDSGPVSRISVSGGPSAWWVRWEKNITLYNLTKQ